MSAVSLDCLALIAGALLERGDKRTFLALLRTSKTVCASLYRNSLLWRRVYVQRFAFVTGMDGKDVQCSGRGAFLAQAAKSVSRRVRRLNAHSIVYVCVAEMPSGTRFHNVSSTDWRTIRARLACMRFSGMQMARTFRARRLNTE